MSEFDWHTFLGHFPVAMGFQLPVIATWVWWKITQRDYNHEAWGWVIGFSFAFLISLSLQLVVGLLGSTSFPEDDVAMSLTTLFFSVILCVVSLLAKDPRRRRFRQGFVYLAILSLIPLMISVSNAQKRSHEPGQLSEVSGE